MALFGALALALIVTGCGPAASQGLPAATTTPGGRPGIQAAPSATKTPDPANISAEGYQFEMTGYEMVAQNVGRVAYGGYACTGIVAEVGACECNTKVAEYVTFTFPTTDTLQVTFEGIGYSSTWEMVRVGANQWSYSVPLFDESGVQVGTYFAMLNFTPDGYIRTEGADFGGAIVTCPDTAFTRVTFDAPALVEAFYAAYLPGLPAFDEELAAQYLTPELATRVRAAGGESLLICGAIPPQEIETALVFFSYEQTIVDVRLVGVGKVVTLFLTPTAAGQWFISDTRCSG